MALNQNAELLSRDKLFFPTENLLIKVTFIFKLLFFGDKDEADLPSLPPRPFGPGEVKWATVAVPTG